MQSKARQQEKVLMPYMLNLVNDAGFCISNVNEIEIEKCNHISNSNFVGDKAGSFEAKGSIILDRKLKRVYATVSRRTSEELVLKYAKQINYEPVVFKCTHPDKKDIHTD